MENECSAPSNDRKNTLLGWGGPDAPTVAEVRFLMTAFEQMVSQVASLASATAELKSAVGELKASVVTIVPGDKPAQDQPDDQVRGLPTQ